MSLTVVLYSKAKRRSRGAAAAAGVSGASAERSASEAQSIANAFVCFLMSLLLASLKAVLKEDVDAVVHAAEEAFVVSPPAKVVGPDEEVCRRAYAVAEVEGAVARARAVAEVLVDGVVRREAGADR